MPPMPRVRGIVRAGGRGDRLQPLTRSRSKAAVPFGARHRIIDYVLSNFVNSGIYALYVLVQYKSQTLIEHVSGTWRIGGGKTATIETLPSPPSHCCGSQSPRNGPTIFSDLTSRHASVLHRIVGFWPNPPTATGLHLP